MRKYQYPGRQSYGATSPAPSPSTPPPSSSYSEQKSAKKLQKAIQKGGQDLGGGEWVGKDHHVTIGQALAGRTVGKKHTHVHHFADGHEEIEEDRPLYNKERYLQVENVAKVVDAFKKNRRGYLGLLTFTVFACLYFIVRQNFVIGAENRALRMPIFLKKPNSKVTTLSGFWSFFSSTIVPYVTKDNIWSADVPASDENLFNHTETLLGYHAMQYSAVIGGIAILQTRGKTQTCAVNMFLPPPGALQSCYSEEPSTDSRITIEGNLDQGNGPKHTAMTIPYDKTSGQYVCLVPSGLDIPEMNRLVAFYEDARLLDQTTRSIEVRIPVYNANIDAIGIFSWKLDIDLAGHISPDLSVSSIPFYLYNWDGSWQQTMIVQFLFCAWLNLMMRNLWKGYLRTHPLPHAIRHWKITGGDAGPMPAAESGRVYMGIPLMLYGTMIFQILLWAYLNFAYGQMHNLTKYEPHKALKFFRKANLNNLDGMEKVYTDVIGPIFNNIEQLRFLFDLYFMSAGVTTVLIIFRMFQFLDFQGKLNAITQTFKMGVGELLHLLLVLNVVATGFSFLGYILFGSQVKAYKTFSSSFVSTWQSCFGLFKLKPAQIKYYNPVAGELFEFLFKMVIIMLLLKMVIAIIFDAYKSTAIKTRKTAPTVPADLRRLWFHFSNFAKGGDGYVPPDLISKFMHSSDTRMIRGTDGVLRERGEITEAELPALLKRVMLQDIPELSQDPKVQVKCDWILERYGKIRCSYNNFGEMTTKDLVKVRKIFDTYDLDGSATISTSEFALALTDLKHPMAQDVEFIQKSLQVVDVDQSGEIEWEEFLMYTAHEAGQTVPSKLLPVHMVQNQAKILATYAELKEQTLNDASGSIWDSKDSMSANDAKAKKSGKQSTKKGDNDKTSIVNSDAVEDLQRELDNQTKELAEVLDLLSS